MKTLPEMVKSVPAMVWLVLVSVVGFIVVIVLLSIGARELNEALINHQVIEPEPGIHCIIVTAQDSSSVDCWEVQ